MTAASALAVGLAAAFDAHLDDAVDHGRACAALLDDAVGRPAEKEPS